AETQGSRTKSSRHGLPDMRRAAARMWAYIRPYGWLLAASLGLVAVVGLLEAVTTVLPGVIYDTFLKDSPAALVSIPFVGTRFNLPSVDPRMFLVMFVIATIIKTSTEYGSITAIAYMGHAVVRDLRNDVFEKIVFQPLRFFHFNPTGELISRVSADIERV